MPTLRARVETASREAAVAFNTLRLDQSIVSISHPAGEMFLIQFYPTYEYSRLRIRILASVPASGTKAVHVR
jgi:hypothetical protein